MKLNWTGLHSGPGVPEHTFAQCRPGLCGEPKGKLAAEYAGAPGSHMLEHFPRRRLKRERPGDG
jgi:hypothetical protein